MLIQKKQSHIREIILFKYYEQEQQFKVQPIFFILFIATLLIIKIIHSGNKWLLELFRWYLFVLAVLCAAVG